MKNNEDVIKFSRYSGFVRQAENLIIDEGVTYKQVLEPVKIERITEQKTIPARDIDLFYSDGTASDRVVPAGTILVNGKYVITEEQLQEKYEPYKDENGNIVPDMYVELVLVKAIKNPFGKPIVKVNDNDYPIRKGDENCYIVLDESSYSRYGFELLSEEGFLKNYVEYTKEETIKKI